MAIINGWHAAADRSGLPRTSLRRLVQRGELVATKRADGTWTFDAEELDVLRAAHKAKCSATSEAPVAKVRNAAPIPIWLFEAATSIEAPSVEDEDIDVEREHEANEPATHEPLGASSSWLHAATAPEPEIVYVQTPITTATIAAAIAPWQAALRLARISEIANSTVAEAAMAGVPPHVLSPVAAHANAALQALSDDQLAHDGYAHAVARAAGQYRAQYVAGQEARAAAWQAEFERERRRREREELELDDLERARRRRAMRTRW